MNTQTITNEPIFEISGTTLVLEPRAVFESMGLRFVGKQGIGRGRPDAYLFDAPDNSTLMMDAPISVETVNAKLAEHDEIVRKFNATLTDEQMVLAIQREEKFQW